MSNSNLCQICTKHEVKYNCPRCDVLYCSLTCYKSPSHSKCSEAFYKECVHKEMELQKKNATPVDENVQKMINILERMQAGDDEFEFLDRNSVEEEINDNESDEEEIDSDDEDGIETDLADRLNGIDLDDSEAIWNQLTDIEKKKFQLLVHSDNVEKLIPIFRPWWKETIEKVNKLVEEVEKATNEKSENNITTPKVVDEIVQFQKLSSRPPAECNYYNLINIIGSYSHMVRFYNGDHYENPKESITYFSRTCGNFKSNTNYDSENNAIESIYHDCNLEGFAVDDKTVLTLKTDIQSILDGPYTNSKSKLYILASLSDLYRLFITAKNEDLYNSVLNNKCVGDFGKKFIGNESVNSNLIKKFKLKVFIKKVEYYLSYVNTFM